jgi:hypothetical protein
MWKDLGLWSGISGPSYVYPELHTDSEAESGSEEDDVQPPSRAKKARTEMQGSELDCIEVAGKASLEALAQLTIAHIWFITTMAMLSSDFCFLLKTNLFNAVSAPRSTLKKYQASLLSLVEWGVLKISRSHCARVFASYFEVPKSKGVSRAILNARQVNALARRPPHFSLAVFSEIVGVIESGTWFYTSDLRHWFYQIKIPPAVTWLFAITVGNIIYECCVLPMGFSWAPYLAQCICTALVLANRYRNNAHKSETAPPAVVSYFDDKNKKCSHIGSSIVIYDNVLIAARNRFYLDNLAADFEENTRKTSVTIKEKEKSQNPKFLGVEFTVLQDLTVWSHCLKNKEKWKQAILQKGPFTRRWVSGLVGVIIWDANVGLRPLCFEKFHIDTLRLVAAEVEADPSSVSPKAKWRKPTTSVLNRIPCLIKAVRNICREGRTFRRVPLRPLKTIWLVSDASKSEDYCGYGALEIEKDTCTIKDIFRGRFPSYRRSTDENGSFGSSVFPIPCISDDIYLLELWTAVSYITKTLKNYTESIHIIILVDNRAVVRALQRFYSVSRIGCRWLETLFLLLKNRRASLQVIPIASAENGSDGPSRGKDIDVEQLKRTIKIFNSDNNVVPEMGTMEEEGAEFLEALMKQDMLNDYLF